MKKFIIYETDGNSNGYEVPKGYTESEVIKFLKDNGYNVLRETGIVGKDESDAIARYVKASKLREEGKEIASPENLKGIQEGIDAETFRGKIPAITKQVATMPVKAVVSTPALVKDIYKKYVLDKPATPTESFVESVTTPYQNPLAEEILGDPTLLPSLFLPGVGEVRAAKIVPKVAEYIGRRGAEGAVQNVASDIAMDRIHGVGDVGKSAVTGTLGGAGGSAVADVAGKGIKAAGQKILQGRLKGTSGEIEQIMSAKTPEGKNVIKPFRGEEDIDKAIRENMKKYHSLQGASIDKVNAQREDLQTRFDMLESEYTHAHDIKKLDKQDFDRVMAVLNGERDRLGIPRPNHEVAPGDVYPTAVEVTGEIPAKYVHNAKVDVGGKSRYDIENPVATASKLDRDTYKDIYKMYSDAVVLAEKEGNKIPPHVKQAIDNYKISYDMFGAIDPRTIKALTEMQEMVVSLPSDYKKYTQAMAPLLTGKDLVEPAIRRGERNLPLSMSMLLAAGAGGAGTQSPWGMMAGALPVLAQGTRTGTGAYRVGESLSSGDRYLLPLGIRTLPETED